MFKGSPTTWTGVASMGIIVLAMVFLAIRKELTAETVTLILAVAGLGTGGVNALGNIFSADQRDIVPPSPQAPSQTVVNVGPGVAQTIQTEPPVSNPPESPSSPETAPEGLNVVRQDMHHE